MGIQDLQAFLEGGHVVGSCVGVDLMRIARTQLSKWPLQKTPTKKIPPQSQPKYSIVVDAECCLDRLYGGYFSDWVCGGQWNRVTTFLGQLVTALNGSSIELAVFFNGCTEPLRTEEWIQEQLRNRDKINAVLKHLAMKGTPPPKVWWTPPSTLRPTLRMVLRSLNVPVFVTMDDHKQEVIAYCRENMCAAILADDGEYVAFNPPRYFSARHIKLTYKGTLESKEYITAEIMKSLELTQEQLCILSALLGNFLLPERELTDLYKKLNVDKAGAKEGGVAEKVKAVAQFIRSLSSSNLNSLAVEIFGVVGGDRAEKFKQAVQYYLDGTKTGMFKFRSYNKKYKKRNIIKNNDDKTENPECAVDTTFASEKAGNELDGLIMLTEAVACLSVGPEIVVDRTKEPTLPQEQNGTAEKVVNGNHRLLTASSSGSSSEAASPSRVENNVKPKKTVRLLVEEDKIVLQPVAAEILRTVSDRHSKGLMTPLIYQILTEGEVKLPVVIEEEIPTEFPSIQHFYRPIRSMVYAILFNLHHLHYIHKSNKEQGKDTKAPEVKVKEWIWTKANPYKKPEIVKAEPLGWRVPTVQRLWFGTMVDDKRRRLRAYLTCMRSDTQLMLDPSYVPQHLLILATVLRFIMSNHEARVFKKQELDAILVMAMDPHLNNSEYNQELQVNFVSTRGVQIGSLIMSGVEYALLANDACGAPIPWAMACPWMFFDGKLLHATLARSEVAGNLPELCNYRTIQVGNVERMREAILDGLFVQWASPLFMGMQESSRVHSVIPAGVAKPYSRGGHVPSRGRGLSTGGRLEIAGVVVGNWGANCRFHQNLMPPPPAQVASVNVPGYARGGAKTANFARSANVKGRGAYKIVANGKKKNNISFNKKDTRKGKTRITTVSSTGEIIDASELIAQDFSDMDEKKQILQNTEPKNQNLNGNVVMNGSGGDDAHPELDSANVNCGTSQEVHD